MREGRKDLEGQREGGRDIERDTGKEERGEAHRDRGGGTQGKKRREMSNATLIQPKSFTGVTNLLKASQKVICGIPPIVVN
jgi:hypothetical protein